MAVHSPLSHFIPRATHSAHTRGHTLGAPRAYDRFVDLLFFGRRRATFESLVAAAGVQPGQRVLDVGCGTGYFASVLADHVGPHGLVLGVDASAEMLDYARRTRARPATCQFELGTAEALGVPDGHFDVVVSSLVMHHLPSDVRAAALTEMRRALRPGGTLLIAEALMPRSAVLRFIARLHGFDRMAQAVLDLEDTIAHAGFDQLRTGEAPPWLRYVRAVKPNS